MDWGIISAIGLATNELAQVSKSLRAIGDLCARAWNSIDGSIFMARPHNLENKTTLIHLYSIYY